MNNIDWPKIWETTGPIIISGVIAIVIAFVCLIISRYMLPRWLKRDLFNVLAVILVAGGFFGTLYITSGIWGNNSIG